MSHQDGLEYLREAAQEGALPSFDALGGIQWLGTHRETLLNSGMLPEVVGVVGDALGDSSDDYLTEFLSAAAVASEDPTTFAAVIDALLTRPSVLSVIGADLVDRWLATSRERHDVTGGMALEAAARTTLAGYGSRYALLDRLIRLNGNTTVLSDEYVELIVRVVGAVAEHEDAPELTELLDHLLTRDHVVEDVAFELGMLALRRGLLEPELEAARQLLLEARARMADALVDENRPDAAAFATALDAVLTFMAGAPLPSSVIEQLTLSVLDFRLSMLGMPPGWRTPRFDTTAWWLRLIETLERAQRAARPGAWLHAGAVLSDLVTVYTAHRSLQLLAPDKHAMHRSAATGGASASELPGLRAVLAPRVEQLLLEHEGGLALLDEWLEELATESKGDEEEDQPFKRIREDAATLRAVISAKGEHPPPKAEGPAGSLILAGLLNPHDPLVERLRDMPELTRRLEDLLAARAAAIPVDESPLVASVHRTITRQLSEQCSEAYTGQFTADIERLLLLLLRFLDSRLQETQGFRGEAGRYLRRLKKDEQRPHEKELGRDLHDFLRGNGLRVRLEVSNIGAGRVDVLWQPHDEDIIIELKRDWIDISWDALIANYLPQVIAYQVGGRRLNFFMVLDLTDKPEGLASLPACVHVTTVKGPAGDPQPRTVVILRVQGNKRDPHSL